MPKNLRHRLADDSVSEFRAAATVRYEDARILASNNRRMAAIYMYGYCAEMILKAAYFRIDGFSPKQPIRNVDQEEQ